MGCAKAHAATGTAYRSVALEHLAQSYLGTGLQFSHWKSALLYHRKHSSDPATFLHAALLEIYGEQGEDIAMQILGVEACTRAVLGALVEEGA